MMDVMNVNVNTKRFPGKEIHQFIQSSKMTELAKRHVIKIGEEPITSSIDRMYHRAYPSEQTKANLGRNNLSPSLSQKRPIKSFFQNPLPAISAMIIYKAHTRAPYLML